MYWSLFGPLTPIASSSSRCEDSGVTFSVANVTLTSLTSMASTKVTMEGCLRVLSLLMAWEAEGRLWGSSQMKMESSEEES